MELNQQQKYLRSAEKRVRKDYPEADPVRQLESFTASAEQSARNARKAQAAELDDRFQRLGAPK